MSDTLKEFRCTNCRRLLAKTDGRGIVQIKCRCGSFNVQKGESHDDQGRGRPAGTA